MLNFDLTTIVEDDYRIWDGAVTVTLEVPRRTPPRVDTDPHLRKGVFADPYADSLVQQTVVVEWAFPRAITTRDQMASGGAYTPADRNWFLPSPKMPVGFTPTVGNVVVEENGTRWTAINVDRQRLGTVWKLTCKDLPLAFGLRDEIDVQRAAISYDAAGVAVKAFPPDGGATIYPRLAARVVQQRQEVMEGRGIRGPKTTYEVIVAKQLGITTEDRILWNGQYLDVTGYRNAERLDELPIVEAVHNP